MDIKNFEDILNCSICLQLLNNPTIDKCGHTFCKNCIINQININGKCPMTNKKTNVEDLLENFMIKNLLETWNPKIKCENCQEEYERKNEEIHLTICQLKLDKKFDDAVKSIESLLEKNMNLEKEKADFIKNLKEKDSYIDQKETIIDRLKNEIKYLKLKINNFEYQNKKISLNNMNMEIKITSIDKFMEKLVKKGVEILKFNKNILDLAGSAYYELSLNYLDKKIFFFFFLENEKIVSLFYFHSIVHFTSENKIKNSIEWIFYEKDQKNQNFNEPNLIIDENILFVEISKENEEENEEDLRSSASELSEDEKNIENYEGFKIAIKAKHQNYSKYFYVKALDCQFLKTVCSPYVTSQFVRLLKIK